jgi:hypothetical protein
MLRCAICGRGLLSTIGRLLQCPRSGHHRSGCVPIALCKAHVRQPSVQLLRTVRRLLGGLLRGSPPAMGANLSSVISTGQRRVRKFSLCSAAVRRQFTSGDRRALRDPQPDQITVRALKLQIAFESLEQVASLAHVSPLRPDCLDQSAPAGDYSLALCNLPIGALQMQMVVHVSERERGCVNCAPRKGTAGPM